MPLLYIIVLSVLKLLGYGLCRNLLLHKIIGVHVPNNKA